jgi:MATE family multidrug resistance protein
MLSSLWQIFDAIGMTMSEALRAAGDTTWCMWARIILAWFVFIPVSASAIFVFHGGVTIVMLSLVGYIALLAAVLAWRFSTGKWRTIELVGEVTI